MTESWAAEPNPDDFWVFAYGSLMWRPGFPHLGVEPALLSGYHRALCVYSRHYRGTTGFPGLVVGLERGGSCRGLAYRVAAAEREKVIAYLEERERITDIYLPRTLAVRIGENRESGARIRAYTFVVNRRHELYAKPMPAAEARAIIDTAHGVSGSCREYIENTVHHLDQLGIADGPLHRMLRDLGEEN